MMSRGCLVLIACVAMTAGGLSAQTAGPRTAPLANVGFEWGDASSMIGTTAYAIKRVTDDAFIGLIAWHADPDPRAQLHLAGGWCGQGCPEIALASDSWQGEDFPTRFYEGQTNGPSLTFIVGSCALGGPIGIESSDGQIIAQITDFSVTKE